MHRLWCVAVLCLVISGPAAAQQPFFVDDADVTPRADWHVEISNQIDRLKAAAYPARWQNTLEWEVDVGVADRVEIALVAPVISILSDRRTNVSSVSGIGDTQVGVKTRFTKAADARHVFAGSLSLELPSGNRARELGSGLVDYGVNAISQHLLRDDLVLRANLGLVLAGNTQTGLIGIRERGTVLTSGASLVRAISPFLQLGGEMTMAWSQKASVRDSTIGWQLGGSVVLRPGMTLDLGLVGGSSSASPRLGLQVGTSIDFVRR
jgi:hypothetical protein